MPLFVYAFFAATLGSLSGLGGGAFLMPFLVQIYGAEYGPASLAAISLSLAFMNALSALFLGGQLRCVDFKYARPMTLFTVVGGFFGLLIQSLVVRGQFELYLAVFLGLLGVYIFWRSPGADAQIADPSEPFQLLDGVVSVLTGVLATFFGVGGGVVRVPFMVYVRRRAVRESTATSQLVLGILAAVSLLILEGVFRAKAPWSDIVFMAPAVFAGGVAGSRLAARLKGIWIVRFLALVLLFLAYRVWMRTV